MHLKDWRGARWARWVSLLFVTCSVAFGAESPKLRGWQEYRTIMWIGDSVHKSPDKFPLFLQRLREMGINTGMVFGDGDPRPFTENHFPYYVENMVNRGLCLKFNSKVTDWDKFVTDWARNNRPETALVRDYCLDDPAWLNLASNLVAGIAQKNAAHEPLAYNLRDELSTTISANPFDYDFNPIALAHFRTWLQSKYADLAALNVEWETQFKTWEEVKPFSTDEIKNRMASGEAIPRGRPDWQKLQQVKFEPDSARRNLTAWNFSPWADFRCYMDRSLAQALESLSESAHGVDPRAPVGIEGTQMPNTFGGYDLWKLSQVLDWVEPYDIGSAREIWGSFMRGKPILTTVFENETRPAQRRLWHLLLEGDRGCLVWWSEDCIDWAKPEWPLSAKAQALTPVLKEMTSSLARLFLLAEPEYDPIFIHYSQPSIQADWLLESTVDGSTWLRRFSSFEAEHNQLAKSRTAWLKGLQDLGWSPQFISAAQLEQETLAGRTNGLLVLPGSLALSDKEGDEINRLLSHPGTDVRVVSEGPTGCFDEHGKLRRTELRGTIGKAAIEQGCLALRGQGGMTRLEDRSAAYLGARLQENEKSAWLDWVEAQLGERRPPIVTPPEGRVRIHRFRASNGHLVAFERNIEYQMSEDLKQKGGNQALEKPLTVEATLAEPAHVYDLRTEQYLGLTNRIRFRLDGWQPSLFALLPSAEPETGIVKRLEERVDRPGWR